jgi:hypothetical protein
MRHLAICALLVAGTLAIYSAVPGFGVVNYDDDVYLGMRSLQDGLSAGNLRFAFGSFYHANYHPLTWLSWFAQIEAFGLRPGPLHAGNVWIHAANGALLYAALFALTRRPLPCALAAALFAWHPLRVESVAWISERKDVLSVFFGLCTLLVYARYARRPSPLSGLGVVVAFALSLLSKGMLVTLPFALLLLDGWPLRRHRAQRWPRLALEKAPLFALAAASCVVTWFANSSEGAMRTLERFPLELRLFNAAAATLRYLWMTIAPVNLSPFYPADPAGPGWLVGALAVGAVAGLSWVAFARRERQPYLWVGWAWFVGSLVPVLGLVQVGEQALADRYAYWPHVGLFVALAFWLDAAAFEERAPRRRLAASAACALWLAALALLSWRQSFVWRDSETLWRHALAVTRDNYVAHANLGRALSGSRPDEARAHFEAALRIRPEAFQPAGGARSEK